MFSPNPVCSFTFIKQPKALVTSVERRRKGSMADSARGICDECACVDKARSAVWPAEVLNEAPNQATMSAEALNKHHHQVNFLPNAEDYVLINCFGKGFGGFSKVFVACHRTSEKLVVVKQTNVDVQNTRQLEELKYEVQVLRSLCHPNILPFYCSFVNRQEVWCVLPLMQFGSCADILKNSFPDGMCELLVSAILWEILQGLEYLHKIGIIHRALKASHILIGANGEVCLSGLKRCIFLPVHGNVDNNQMAHQFPSHAVAVLPWMAPEILQQDLRGYDFQSDIYSFGITAIELARGIVPYLGMPPTKILLDKLKGNSPKLCDTLVVNDPDSSVQLTTSDSGVESAVTSVVEGRDGGQPSSTQENFSTSFQQVVDWCLQRDPALRPSISSLTCHMFFKQVKRKTKEIVIELLSPVPSLANCSKDKRLDQEIATSIAAEHLSAMTLDEWTF